MSSYRFNHRLITAAVCTAGVLFTAGAQAQSFPVKPIRIVTAEPGSGNDLLARLIAQNASPRLGQQVIVDNRGVISIETVAHATPDGYTLLLYGTPLWLTPFMRDKTDWDPVKDFTSVTWATNAPNILLVHPTVPVNSVKDLIALAKSKPGQINYGSGSAGSTSHLAAELFKAMAGVDMVRIPYKGSGPALNAFLGGEFQVIFPSASAAAPHIKSGRAKALAVASLQPSALAPGLPTVASTLPGYESASILGIFAPAGTPKAVITRINQEFVRALNVPEVKEKLFSQGVEVVASTPEQLTQVIAKEMQRMGKVIKDAHIRDE